jgi:hypothetical protein
MIYLKLAAVVVTTWLLAGGVDVRRAAGEPAEHSDENVELIRELMRRRGGDPAALAQLVQLTRFCSPAKTAELFGELAKAHWRAGDLNLAATTRQLLVERFPDEPAAKLALRWLVRLYASSEVAWAHRPPTPTPAANLKLVPRAEARLASAETESEAPAAKSRADADLAMFALSIADKAALVRPALVDDPALTVQRAAAARRLGDLKASQGYLVSLKHTRAGDGWGDCARMENWLAEARDAPPPKPVMTIALAATRPHLDGVLGEPCWQGQATNVGGALAWLAHDHEYLYLAVSCQKLAGVDYPRDARPRPHDGDVDQFDHVRVRLDLDRDYATCYELVVDSRGWTADRAWGDPSWNPEWFVAAVESNGAWTAEAAIAWAELAERLPRAGDAWACRLERRAASQQRQRWPEAEKSSGPGGYGLLLFE